MTRMNSSSDAASAHLGRLADLDPTSEESIALIRLLLPHCLQFEDHEAQLFMDVLDKTMTIIHADTELYRRCLRGLRRLCGSRGLLPSSYLLTDGLARKNDWPVARGGFADVWEGTHKNRRIAIKSMRVYMSTNLAEVRQAFYKEVVIWKQLSHPNVVPFLGVTDVYSPMSIISEWMPYGNINEYLSAHPDTNRMRLLLDVCTGLHYLHSHEIVHHDLKGANILINSSGQACLSDFGLTSVVSRLNTINASTIISGGVPRGTCRWMAPELLDPELHRGASREGLTDSTATDIYALSMVMIEVLSSKPPFPELSNDPSVMLRVIQGGRPLRSDEMVRQGLSDEVWSLMERCWDQKRSRRPKISFVLDRMRAITPGLSPLERLEGFDPSSEGSIYILRTVLDRSLTKMLEFMEREQCRQFIDILGRAMDFINDDEDLRRRCLDALAIIYGQTHLLPSSYLLTDAVVKTYDSPTYLGAFSDIYEGSWNDRVVAIEVYRTSRLDSNDMIRKLIFEQAATWKPLSHQNIVAFLGIPVTLPPCIVSEWMPHGRLMDYLRIHPEVDRLPLLIDIGSGLEYLHLRGIVHGDLKAAHILINASHQACITGIRNISVVSISNSPVSPEFGLVSRDSSRLVAPETLNPEGLANHGFSLASDIYSLATVFLEVFASTIHFPAIRRARHKVPREAAKLGLTTGLWKLMQMCWQKEPELRPKISSVLEHLRRPAQGMSCIERLGLADFDPGSENYMNNLRSALNSDQDLNLLLECSDHDKVMDVLDRALFAPFSDAMLDEQALQVFFKLWDRERHLPPSYYLMEQLEFNERLESEDTEALATDWKGSYQGLRVSVKAYRASSPIAMKMFVNDVVIRKRLSHPNIVPFLGVSYLHPYCVITPYMPHGSLEAYMRVNPVVNRLPLQLDIARGLNYLHSLNIAHGNPNIRNVLVNEDGRACLSDFRLAVIFDPSLLTPVDISYMMKIDGDISDKSTDCSKLMRKHIDPTSPSIKSDLYAFGLLQRNMYSDPSRRLSNRSLATRILTGERFDRPDIGLVVKLHDDLRELVKLCSHEDPDQRPAMSTVLEQLEAINDRLSVLWSEGSSSNDNSIHNNSSVNTEFSFMSDDSPRKSFVSYTKPWDKWRTSVFRFLNEAHKE